MNELLDGEVIARLRSALDEVTEETHGLVPMAELRPRVSVGRWMAAAAAIVLIAGAVAAIAVNRGNSSEVASTPTSAPDTTVPITEPVLIRSETPWFRLVAADLVPGERVHEQCCRADGLLTMAWSNGDKYLTVTEYPAGGVVPSPENYASTLNVGGISATLGFHSFGLTADERNSLAIQVVPGSGLPYLLPVDGWQLAAMGNTGGDSRLTQMYTALNVDPLSSYMPTVTMSVGEYRGELDSLARWPDPQPITVAGYEGWKVAEGDGTVSAFWYAGDGNWATLRIDAQLADRADALIAGVVQVTEDSAPTVETVLAPTVNTAVAETTPTPSDPIGRLTIPALGFDWIVVNSGSGASLSDTAKLGPVLVAGPLPGHGADGETSIIWGNRTTYGAPFENIDHLVVGDIIQWIGADGAESTFEVIGSTTGRNADIPDGASLQLHTSAPEYTSKDPLVVYARRTA